MDTELENSLIFRLKKTLSINGCEHIVVTALYGEIRSSAVKFYLDDGCVTVLFNMVPFNEGYVVTKFDIVGNEDMKSVIFPGVEFLEEINRTVPIARHGPMAAPNYDITEPITKYILINTPADIDTLLSGYDRMASNKGCNMVFT